MWLVELGKRRVQGGRLYLRILASPPDHFSASVLVSPIFILLTALPNNKRVAFLLTAFTPSLPFFYFLLFFLFFIFYFFFYFHNSLLFLILSLRQSSGTCLAPLSWFTKSSRPGFNSTSRERFLYRLLGSINTSSPIAFSTLPISRSSLTSLFPSPPVAFYSRHAFDIKPHQLLSPYYVPLVAVSVCSLEVIFTRQDCFAQRSHGCFQLITSFQNTLP